MKPQFRQQIDAGILDHAAAVIARRGFDKASVQEIADAAGLSKAGLLHHFPSKDALLAGVLAHARSVGDQVLTQVEHLETGPERDRRALDAVADAAEANPGLVSLLLGQGLLSDQTIEFDDGPEGPPILRAFGVDHTTVEPERAVRVLGAVAALAILTVTCQRTGTAAAWRPYVLATCTDALGHHRPGATGTSHDTLEH